MTSTVVEFSNRLHFTAQLLMDHKFGKLIVLGDINGVFEKIIWKFKCESLHKDQHLPGK